jgi:hypothetical protein
MHSQNHKLQCKPISPFCDDLPHFESSLGAFELWTTYELCIAVYHVLVATNSSFSSATRLVMCLVDKVAAVSVIHGYCCSLVQSSVQHQLSSPLLWTSQPSEP